MDESAVDASRHHRCLRGDEFVDELQLPGWDWRSVWSFDNHHRSCFAGLWRNGSRAPVPDICLSEDPARVYWWPGCIALELLAITEHDPTTLVRAMSIADPGRAGAREEIARESERGGWRIAAGEMIVNETLGIACLEVAAGVRVRTHNGSSDRD